MGGSEGVTRAAKTYFSIRIWSAPLALANYVVLGWLIGQARARLALGVQIAINVINMAATVLLVLVLDAGIAGAAIAAVIAEAAGLLLGVADRAAPHARTARRAARDAVRPRQADAHAGGQSRHHDPHRGADRGVPVLHRARRPRRRRDARRQRGAEQFPADQRLLPRRPRQRRRAALRPGLWRARPERLFRRGPAGDARGALALRSRSRVVSRCSALR